MGADLEEERARCREAEFDRLGRTFDEVAYGHRPASAADAADAKRDWERVLVEAGKQS